MKEEGEAYGMDKAEAQYQRCKMRASLTRWVVDCHDKALLVVSWAL
jgi:hypothetical protein